MMLRQSLVTLFYICIVTIILVPKFISTKRIEKRQVHLENRIPQVKQWYLSDTPVSMNVKSAWRDGYTGKGVLVAVVDDGVNIHHPDLKLNMNLTASYDFLEDRDIGTNHNPGDHGTSCAGIIAGADNEVCGVGVAFGAQISSLRIYDDITPSTDQLEAKALSFRRDMIDIYSNSWGPGDSGLEVSRLGPRLKEALENGTRLGRHGKGSIFVFAAGNGGINGDSCAFNGYANSIHTIAITGVNWDGSVPAYSEQCAAIMAVTYGQDMYTYGKVKPSLITAKGAHDCIEWFPGSSANAAFASGIIALALQANPDLTWRDVQYLIARSSKPFNPPFTTYTWQRTRPRLSWRKNKANLTVSSYFGFGLMDARSMIKYAKDWRSVPKQLSCEVKLDVSNSKPVIPSSGDLHLSLSVKQDDCSIQYLEHMQVEADLRFHRRGYLEMLSTSPSGTQSKLLYSRRMDIFLGGPNLINWRVTSLHYWGERPTGDWKLTIKNTSPRSNLNPGRTGRLFGLKLFLYGTKEDPLKNNPHVDRRQKDIETVDLSRRKTEFVTHGGYTQWSGWDPCSRTCGGGIQQRFRWCNNPRPENGGRDCSRLGKASESKKCFRARCPVNGRFSEWGSWSHCDVTCGVGYKQRMRTCTNPAPAHGGRQCSGKPVESKKCRLNTCPPENCQDPGTPQNGSSYGNSFDHGDVIKFACENQTHDLIGAQEIKCSNGKWSDSVPTCEAKCNDPRKPENGTKDGEDYRSGANVTFRCSPPFDILGTQTIRCKNGKWSSSTPICTSCGRPVITPYVLNGQSAWCRHRQTYLQIDLGGTYKLTAIATQGGTRFNTWVKRYRISFNAGATPIYYSEAGYEKFIEGNEDSSSVVIYHFKEPFVTKLVRIYPDVVDASRVCLRTELYGCDPDPDCILVGSQFWGLWTRKDNSLNYYKAYITKVNATHLDFALEYEAKPRSYKRTEQVLITDKAVEMKEISVDSRVIAVHKRDMKEWYRTGTVTNVSTSKRSASVKFDNGDQRLVPLGQLRLVKRPVYC